MVWNEQGALDAFLDETPLVKEWEQCPWAWHVRATPLQSRGTFRGSSPLADVPRSAPEETVGAEGPIAVLTLGRTSWRSTLTFIAITPKADAFLRTPGLITGLSAGLPARGNCTFTLWESEAAMQRFAYGQPPGAHRETIRRSHDGSVLREQLSARLTPTRIDGRWNPYATPNAHKLDSLAVALRAKGMG